MLLDSVLPSPLPLTDLSIRHVLSRFLLVFECRLRMCRPVASWCSKLTGCGAVADRVQVTAVAPPCTRSVLTSGLLSSPTQPISYLFEEGHSGKRYVRPPSGPVFGTLKITYLWHKGSASVPQGLCERGGSLAWVFFPEEIDMTIVAGFFLKWFKGVWDRQVSWLTSFYFSIYDI